MKETILKRIKHLSIQLIIFGITYLISIRLKDIYFFGWLTHNKFAYIWVAIILFTMFGGTLYSYAITIGNVIGILIGQFLGEYLLNAAKAKITPEMDAAERGYLSNSYYHVFIWLSFIIVVVLLVFINKFISKRIGRLKE